VPRGPARPPWRDEPLFAGKSPRQILKDISAGLCISAAEIELILTRTDKLRMLHPELTRGRDMVTLILASAISWVRWSGSRRKPMPYPRFISLCIERGYYISNRQIINCVRLYRKAGLYEQGPKAPELLERHWGILVQNYGFDNDVKTDALRILNDRRFVQGRKPELAVATTIYVVCTRKYRVYVTKKALAEMFGTTDVGMRLVIHAWEKIPDFRKEYPEALACS